MSDGRPGLGSYTRKASQERAVSLSGMPSSVDLLPEVVGIDPASAAEGSGIQIGDRIVSVNGVVPRDILEWVRLVDEESVELVLVRGRTEETVIIHRKPGTPFGVGISSAVFDRVQTCDNHCEFCFIYQLPKGMRRSLYLKDDDYRLSFLFGNFTTLTRFTEADAERVLSERLSPLHVSVHAAAPAVRAEMLRNSRGGFSLRWAKILLTNAIGIKAQIVLCPGVNDGQRLDDTMARLLEEMPEIESIAVVPLGLSRHNTESRMRVHTPQEASVAVDQIAAWSEVWKDLTGRNVVHAADELYLLANREVPEASSYDDYPMLEDGIGLVRSFMDSFANASPVTTQRDGGFFSNVDGTGYVRAANPAADTALRPVGAGDAVSLSLRKRSATLGHRPICILTGVYAAPVISRALASEGFEDIVVHAIPNTYFGGNTGVAGLLTGADIVEHLADRGPGFTYLLPDVCLNSGRFLDDTHIDELAQNYDIRVVPTDGGFLRQLLNSRERLDDHVH